MSSASAKTVPSSGDVPDVSKDAFEAFHVLKSGGVIIVPTEVGYGLISNSAEGIERAFAAKKRIHGHTLGIVGTYQQHRQLHILPAEKFEMTKVITQDHGALLAVVAPYTTDHPRLQQLSAQTLERVTKGGTLGIAISEGPFLNELGRLNDADGQLMVGSSANLTGQGQKFRVEDIEPDILECADLIVDYGLQRYYRYQRAGTVIDFHNMKVLRFGAGYELFRHRMQKWFGIDFPQDPEHSTEVVGSGSSLRPHQSGDGQ